MDHIAATTTHIQWWSCPWGLSFVPSFSRNSEVPSSYCAYLCSMSENSNSVNVTAESCECDRWRVRHSSSSKSSVASLENRRLLTFAKFAEKHRQNPRLLENLSESKAPGWRILKTREVKVPAYKCLLSLCIGRFIQPVTYALPTWSERTSECAVSSWRMLLVVLQDNGISLFHNYIWHT